jgi:hypothetical protein
MQVESYLGASKRLIDTDLLALGILEKLLPLWPRFYHFIICKMGDWTR